MANPEEDEAQTSDAPLSKEEEEDTMRLQQLAEELAAESRMTFDDKTNTMNLKSHWLPPQLKGGSSYSTVRDHGEQPAGTQERARTKL